MSGVHRRSGGLLQRDPKTSPQRLFQRYAAWTAKRQSLTDRGVQDPGQWSALNAEGAGMLDEAISLLGTVRPAISALAKTLEV